MDRSSLPLTTVSICSSILIAALLTLAPTQSPQAETYRWVDDNGVVNYSERRPRGISESRLTIIPSSGKTPRPSPSTTSSVVNSQPGSQPASSPRPAGPAQDNLSEDQQAMLEQLQSAEAQRQEQIARIRQDNCQRSRRVLANLTSMGRIRVTSESGQQRVLPEDERNQRIAEAQQGIAENCDS